MSSSLGTEITVAALERDPHPLLARLRDHEPVAWIPALDGWLVTRYDLVREVMRDPVRFTVDDPRFSTAQVIGPSMLSLDGAEHARHRAPFVGPFRARAVKERFAELAQRQAEQLVDGIKPAGEAELRRSFAGPLAAAIVARALGLETSDVPSVMSWYDAIVSAVTEITAGEGTGDGGRQAFLALRSRLEAVIDDDDSRSLLAAAAQGSELGVQQTVSNAAVLLFGGFETTEGMIANALLAMLASVQISAQVRADPSLIDPAIEESLRLEPAAAVIDRYATAHTSLDGVEIAGGDLVRLSISAANRDPAVFENPDSFDLFRGGAHRHLAFAQGPHVCVGVHLARLEARTGIRVLLERLPALRLDPQRPTTATGLVFRKPDALWALWD